MNVLFIKKKESNLNTALNYTFKEQGEILAQA